MEFDTNLDYDNLTAPFQDKTGTMLLMSHEWVYHFDEIMRRYPDALIQLVYRPDDPVSIGGCKRVDLTYRILTMIGMVTRMV